MAVEEAEQAGIEKQIERAICSRVQHFKDQADSLTLESVRRLLEKDLGLEKFALDAYKRFVRQYLEKKMDGADDYKSKIETENVDKGVHSIKEETTSPKPHEMKNNLKKSSTRDEEMMEDSRITPKSEPDKQGSSEDVTSRIAEVESCGSAVDTIQIFVDTVGGVRKARLPGTGCMAGQYADLSSSARSRERGSSQREVAMQATIADLTARVEEETAARQCIQHQLDEERRTREQAMADMMAQVRQMIAASQGQPPPPPAP